MEVYLLDSLMRRTEVVDKFESMIWTERWQETGDFSLDIFSTRSSRSQFIVGQQIAINKSYRVMTVETVEDKLDSDGRAVLNVKGRSLEAYLDDRLAKPSMDNLSAVPKWVITDQPADVARKMFDDICRLGLLNLYDIIPFIMPGSLLPLGNIPEPETAIIWEQEPDSLKNAIQKLCQLYDLGYRLVRNFDASQLYFEIYPGYDRTTKQSLLPPVIFAPSFDNLQNTTELTNIQDSKNVALVFSEVGSLVVYPDGVDPDQVVGFDRRVLYVNASDVTAETVNIMGALETAGKQALNEHRTLSAFDGELNQNSQYVYGRDYGLGDLCELRNQDGIITNRRVSEQIFVCDSEGEKDYPTLAANDFIMGGTWLTAGDAVWADFTTEHWAEM